MNAGFILFISMSQSRETEVHKKYKTTRCKKPNTPVQYYFLLSWKDSHVQRSWFVSCRWMCIWRARVFWSCDKAKAVRRVFLQRTAGQHHSKRLPLSAVADRKQLTTIMKAFQSRQSLLLCVQWCWTFCRAISFPSFSSIFLKKISSKCAF